MTTHETLFRGTQAMETLEMARIVVCGVGALGSQFTDNLARHGAKNLLVIDKDRVEEHNIGTQVFDRGEIGAWKAESVSSRVFRATGAEIEGINKELTPGNIGKLTRGADVVVDCFDNSASRALLFDWCRDKSLPCLHLGVNADYGEVRWNEEYQVPGDVVGVGACDYPLARNLLLFVVAIGSESLLRFLWRGEKRNFSFTLEDFSINLENTIDNVICTIVNSSCPSRPNSESLQSFRIRGSSVQIRSFEKSNVAQLDRASDALPLSRLARGILFSGTSFD